MRKWQTSSIFVFCPFSCEKIEKLIKVYWIWQVAVVRSINHNVGTLAELTDVNIKTGAQSFTTEGSFRQRLVSLQRVLLSVAVRAE